MRQSFVIRVYDRKFLEVVEGVYLFILIDRKDAECWSSECDKADSSGSKRLADALLLIRASVGQIEYGVEDGRFRNPITGCCECYEDWAVC